MNSTSSFLQKCWRKLAGPIARRKHVCTHRLPGSVVEPLEDRIAPAALLNSSTLIYKDSAGDIVTIKFSRPVFTSSSTTNLTNANAVFHFLDSGSVAGTVGSTFDASTAPAEQLQLVDLTKAPGSLFGAGLTISAARHAESADVGYINAGGISLGAVKITGDLGRIDAGAAGASFGVKSLHVHSIGARSIDSQQVAGASLISNITGRLGSLTVATDVKYASIRAVTGSDFFGRSSNGAIGSVTIGGSLIGNPAAGTASDNTGLIDSANTIGAVKIGSVASGSIIGGGGLDSGSIHAGTNIHSVTVIGKVSGGQGTESGSVRAGGVINALNINGDLVAGAGADSGWISSLHGLGPTKIGGSIDGTTAQAGAGSGGFEIGGGVASITVHGAMKGGAGAQSGSIDITGNVSVLSLHDIIGGTAQSAGTITVGGTISTLAVTGNISGGTALDAGSVFSGMDTQLSGAIGSIKIGGMLIGGSAASAGTISSGGKIGALVVGLSQPANQNLLQGNTGDFSGSVLSHGGIGSAKIAGNIQGGGGKFSGSIVSHDLSTPTVDLAGDLGNVKIGGNVTGGAGDDSGQIRADGNLKKLSIGAVTGAGGARSGSILAGEGIINRGNIGAVQLRGTLTGTGSSESGSIIAQGRIARITISKAATGSTIRSGDDIGALTFKAGVLGLEVSARGQAIPTAKTDLAIGKLTVIGNVATTQFLAGYDTALSPSNPGAQIGTVLVKGDWTASDLVAGVTHGTAVGFGTAADAPIAGTPPPGLLSTIASVIITGKVSGTAAPGDHFGFSAERIVSFSVGGTKLAFTKLGQSFELDPANNDVTAREVNTTV